MSAFGWVLVAFFTLGSLASIYMVGRPRKPTTPLDAVVAVVINAALIVAIALWWPR